LAYFVERGCLRGEEEVHAAAKKEKDEEEGPSYTSRAEGG
jgi:hypothetical protein